MSAQTTADVSNIRDEDILRQMWQDTADFGRKKEIRSHMYKLREERLRNFYSSTAETSNEIHRTQSTPGLHDKNSKDAHGPTHADSLMDHSFLSLKSKEIRDSESPTRDMSYKITERQNGNKGWNVVSKNETSNDGKTHSTSRIATTSGSDKIEGGISNYAAKCEQNASVFADGDDKNYIKSVGTNSKNVIKQEARGGDENSNFQTFSTSSSSSSKQVTHQRTSGEEPSNVRALPPSSGGNIVRKVYTNDVPAELKRNPNYVDGNTVVTTETRTLADGSKVTTTRYETKGSTTAQSSSKLESHSRNTFQDVKKTSSTQNVRYTENDVRGTNDNRIIRTQNIQNQNVPTDEGMCVTRIVKETRENVPSSITSTHRVTTTKGDIKQNTINQDDVRITRVIQENEYLPRSTHKEVITKDVRDNVINKDQYPSSSTTTTHKEIHVTKGSSVQENVKNNVEVTRVIKENERVPYSKPTNDVNSTVTSTIQKEVIIKRDDSKPYDINKDDVHITRIIQENEYIPRSTKPEQATSSTTTTKTTTYKQNIQEDSHKDNRQVIHVTNETNKRPEPERPSDSPHQEIIIYKHIPDDSRSTPSEKQPQSSTVVTTTTRKEIIKNTNDVQDIQNKKQTDIHVTRQVHDINPTSTITYKTPDSIVGPKKHSPRTCESIPGDNTPGFTTPGISTPGDQTPIGRPTPNKIPFVEEVVAHLVPKPQEQQKPPKTDYSTTYRADYVNKRISVEVSPAHDAFARSLRAVTPDRDKKRGSTKSLKSSTSSLRSSASPDKRYSPCTSPIKRESSPTKKMPGDSRETSPSKRVVPDRYPSPVKDRKPATTKGTPRSPVKSTPEINTNTITRRPKPETSPSKTIDSSTLTRRPKNKPRSRSVSPTTIASDIEYVETTDLDVENSTVTTTIKKVTDERPTTLDYITSPKKPKKITDRSPSSPVCSPSKKTPEKPFKRRDTYEERCRQILGITTETSTKSTPNDASRPLGKKPQTDDSTKLIKKPTKEITEFPSQTRKSPTKSSPKFPEQKFTQKFINTLCREDEVQRKLQKELYHVTSDTKTDQPHKTVKKDSPDKPKSTPHKRQPTTTETFINHEKTTDHVVKTSKIPQNRNPYETSPREQSKSPRESPDRVCRIIKNEEAIDTIINEINALHNYPKSPQRPKSPEKQPRKDSSSTNLPKDRESPERIYHYNTQEVTKRTDDFYVKNTIDISDKIITREREIPEREPMKPKGLKPDDEVPRGRRWDDNETLDQSPDRVYRKPSDEIPLGRKPEDTPSGKRWDDNPAFDKEKSPQKVVKTNEQYPRRDTYSTIDQISTMVSKEQITRDLPQQHPKGNEPDDNIPRGRRWDENPVFDKEPSPTRVIKSKDTNICQNTNETINRVTKTTSKTHDDIPRGRRWNDNPDLNKSRSPERISNTNKTNVYERVDQETKTVLKNERPNKLLDNKPKYDENMPRGRRWDDNPVVDKEQSPHRTINVKQNDTVTDHMTKTTTYTCEKPQRESPERKPASGKPGDKPKGRRWDDNPVFDKEHSPDRIIKSKETKVFKTTNETTDNILETTEKSYRPRESPERKPQYQDNAPRGRRWDDNPIFDKVDSPERNIEITETSNYETLDHKTITKNEKTRKSSDRKPQDDDFPRGSRWDDNPVFDKETSPERITKTGTTNVDYKTKTTQKSQKTNQSPERKPKQGGDTPRGRRWDENPVFDKENSPDRVIKIKDKSTCKITKETTDHINKTNQKNVKPRESPESKPRYEDAPRGRRWDGNPAFDKEQSPHRTIKSNRVDDYYNTTETVDVTKKVTSKSQRPSTSPDRKPKNERPRYDSPEKLPKRNQITRTQKSPENISTTYKPTQKSPDRTTKVADEYCTTRTTEYRKTNKTTPETSVKVFPRNEKPKNIRESPKPKGPTHKSPEINERYTSAHQIIKNTAKSTTKLISERPKTIYTTKVTQKPIKNKPEESEKRVPKTAYSAPKGRKPDKASPKICSVTEYADQYYDKTTGRIITTQRKKYTRDESPGSVTRTDDETSDTEFEPEWPNGDVPLHMKPNTKTTKSITTYNNRNIEESRQYSKAIPNGDVSKPKTKKPIEMISTKSTPKSQTTITKRITSKTTNLNDVRTKTIEPKRHVVTTTIQVVPKTKPQYKPSNITKQTQPKTVSKKPRMPCDDDVFSESESEIIETLETYTTQGEIVRKTNAKTTKVREDVVKPFSRTPGRGKPKPGDYDGTKPTRLSDINKINKSPERKVVTTKSILINNDYNEDKEFVVNLQRSTSSREATPDGIYLRPVTDEEDTGYPRYPDEIREPDEPSIRRKPTRLSDIPIIETEVFDEKRTKITEKVDRVENTDECLLSVNQKVSKFVDEAERLKRPSPSRKLKPEYDGDEIQRPKSPRFGTQVEDENFNSVSDKVSHFIETAEKVSHSQKPKLKDGPAPKVQRPDFIEIDETIKTDQCLLSVSDKVNRFSTTIQTDKKPISLSKMDVKPQRRTPSRESSPTKLAIECVQIETEEDTYVRQSTSMRRESSPRPRPEDKTPRRSSIKRSEEPDSTPKSSRRDEEPKIVLSPTGRIRSTESIRKAKELFESIAKDQKPKQRDILNRPSVFESKKTAPCDERPGKDSLKSTRLVMDKIKPHSPERNGDVPHYMQPLDRTPHTHSPHHDRSQSPRHRSKSPSPKRERTPHPHDQSLENIPHYMWPLDRTPHDHTPDRSRSHSREPSPDYQTRRRSRDSTPDNDTPGYMKPLNRKQPEEANRTTKFGVTLKRTDSGRTSTTTTTTTTTAASHKRKLSIAEIDRILSHQEIEEIYDLEILELLLERAVTYEQRRRIRSQIRIVKQTITEKSTEIMKYRGTSPEKPSKIDKRPSERPPFRKSIDEHYQTEESSFQKKTSKTFTRDSSFEHKTTRVSPEKITRRSPERKTQKIESKSVFKTELKRTEPTNKTVVEEKPSWAIQRPLKKAATDAPPSRKPPTTTTTTTVVKKNTGSHKERKPIDDITSSYGVGPTDENGSPLFGLRALRAQNKTETTKLQGTVIKSHYYSENGEEPRGEISVTKYSNNPNDFEGDVENRDGLVSVTTTQKFGTKGTPTYNTIVDKKKIPQEFEDEICENVIKKSTHVTRRGSVKEMSKKFIENAVETSKNERQSSYPKAGLILRTSSFKDTVKCSSGSSREASPDNREETITTTVRETMSSSGGETFLNTKTRVRGVQDVITRMKNSEHDVQEGESTEDAEARSLLNKFIGSQVILSGMENRSCSSPSSTSTVRRTTTTTSTTKGGGKPTIITRTFTHPISEEEINTVWDEQTLKLLLERSTEYEERQIIRNRLREVMAEQEESVETTKKIVTEGPTTTTQVTTKVTSQQVSKKPISPFAKFRQLDKQNSLNSPPGTPRTPTGSRPLFKFTDPELNRQASTVKERLLQWCQMKTKEYENIQLDNFSTSWADGLGFCALIHHFLPDAFDYQALTPKDRRHNFTLAFKVADEKADIVPLLDVDDMVATRKPDWKCVFTYVQTIYSRFKNED